MTPAATVDDEPLRGATAAEAYRRFWRRIVVFSGRASLSETWWPVLVNTLVLLGVAVVIGVLLALGSVVPGLDSVTNALASVLGLVLLALSIAMLLASIAVGVRRLHDADLPGPLLLLGLVPSVGGIIVAVLALLPANPRGARFDRGPQSPVGGTTGAAPRVLEPLPAFDAWPAPSVATETAPVPLAVPADVADERALHDAWASAGAVEPVEAPRPASPGLRDQRWLLVRRPEGDPLLATDGLHAGEGVAALGPGAELFVEDPEPGPGSWRGALLAAVSRRVRASGLHLPAELQRYGTLSMALAGVPAPEGWRTGEDRVGVLLGLPQPGLPATVVTAAGEVALVSVVPLRPAELEEIIAGGGPARDRVAGRLAAMPAHLRAARA